MNWSEQSMIQNRYHAVQGFLLCLKGCLAVVGLSKELLKTMKPSSDYLPSIELTIFATGKKNKKNFVSNNYLKRAR